MWGATDEGGGNLGIWEPAPCGGLAGSQDSSFSGFSPAPRGGRNGAAASPPLRHRRLRSGRVGRVRGAGMAPPMAGRRASLVARGEWVRWAARRVLARARSAGAVVLKRDIVLPTLK